MTPVELFFNLAFVFGVSQLSHYLREHLTVRRGLETIILMLAVLKAWEVTSWSATIMKADRWVIQQMVLIVMLLASL